MQNTDRDFRNLAILIGISLLLLFFDLGGRDLWDIDEGMHAAIAQAMVTTGDWITPRFNGEAFLDKPPLFNWLTALAFVILGFTEFAARLSPALSALGCVVLVYSLTRKIFDARSAFLAGVVLLTSLEFLILARVVQYDVPFTFFVTLALYCFACGVLDGERKSRYFVGLYAAAAFAVLVKGPIGVLLPGIPIVGYVLVRRQYVLLRELLMPGGILVFCVIAVPWFVLMEKANDGYLNYFVLKQHFGNFLGGDGAMAPRHPEPFYYYVPVFVGGLLPWILTIPQSVRRAFVEDRDSRSGMALFLTIWMLGIVAFFSLATSKLSTYILPAFPAAAVLVGRYWRELFRQPSELGRRWLLIGTGSVFSLLALFTAFVIVADPWTYWDFRTGIKWPKFELFMVLFSGLFGLAFALFRMRRWRLGFATFCAISPFFVFYLSLLMVPDVDSYKGAKDIAALYTEKLAADDELHFHGQMLDSAMFYSDRNAVMLHTEEELVEYLNASERRYVLVRTRARRAEDAFIGNYHVLTIRGNKAIVSNRAP